MSASAHANLPNGVGTTSASRRRTSNEAPHADIPKSLGQPCSPGAAARRLRQLLARWRCVRGQRDHRPALGENAVAVRTPEQADAARAARQGALAPAAHRGPRRRLRWSTTGSFRLPTMCSAFPKPPWCRRPCRQSHLFAGADRGRGRPRNRGPYRRKPAAARNAAGARRHRGGAFPAGAVSGGIGNLGVASEARRAFYRAVAARAVAAYFAQARETGQTAASSLRGLVKRER